MILTEKHQPSQSLASDAVAAEAEPKQSMFAGDNIATDTTVQPDEASTGFISTNGPSNPLVLTAHDKITFIDALVANKRWTRQYSLFGGNVTVVLRTLTNEEMSAIMYWTLKEGQREPLAQVSGKQRKFILEAMVAQYNGTHIPPLQEPLFETLDDRGNVKAPGWIDKCDFWDGLAASVISSIMNCASDFEKRYATLCNKANDENFWKPDTH